jgi:hypothetical protein
VIANKWGSLAMAALAALSLGAWRERPVRWLLAFLVLWTLLWYFGTHRVDRFWLPFAGVAAALAGCGFALFVPSPSGGEGSGKGCASPPAKKSAPHPDPLPPVGGEGTPWYRRTPVSWALCALLVVALGWQVYVNSLIFAYNAAGNYDLKTGNEDFLAQRYNLTPLIRNSHFAYVGDYLLVGEAQTLYLPAGTRSSTVFNEEVFTRLVDKQRDPERIRGLLMSAGVGKLFVNWFEVGRLRESYTYTGRDGRVVPGFPDISPRDFKRLEDAEMIDYISDEQDKHGFPRAREKLRGLSEEDMRLLPHGRIAAMYVIDHLTIEEVEKEIEHVLKTLRPDNTPAPRAP